MQLNKNVKFIEVQREQQSKKIVANFNLEKTQKMLLGKKISGVWQEHNYEINGKNHTHKMQNFNQKSIKKLKKKVGFENIRVVSECDIITIDKKLSRVIIIVGEDFLITQVING